eukprot:scaffold223531_cov46-Prasinocladus_malaysianus.AAC.1
MSFEATGCFVRCRCRAGSHSAACCLENNCVFSDDKQTIKFKVAYVSANWSQQLATRLFSYCLDKNLALLKEILATTAWKTFSSREEYDIFSSQHPNQAPTPPQVFYPLNNGLKSMESQDTLYPSQSTYLHS